MTRIKRHVQHDHGIEKETAPAPPPPPDQKGRRHMAGKNRDFDERSENTRHGHPREERVVSNPPIPDLTPHKH
ncbi:MAG TPA: hypothetical protein VFQ38_20610 [Longimicrobiales bacterium]|nr:hypothetical protein [Longimicrobiales bacterium]